MPDKKLGSHALSNSAVSLLYGLAVKVEPISKKRYRITKGEEPILQLLDDAVGLSNTSVVDIVNRFFGLISKDAENYIRSKLTNQEGIPIKSETPEELQTVTYRGQNKIASSSSSDNVTSSDSKKSQVLYRGRRIAE